MEDKEIAIIGMSGYFPEAREISEFLENLKAGKNSLNHLSSEQIEATTLNPYKPYRVGGYLEDIDKFDHNFFNISLGEAQAMDPHQRLMIEVLDFFSFLAKRFSNVVGMMIGNFQSQGFGI